MALRGHHKERAQRSRADIVKVADDLVWRKRRGLVLGCTHVARQNRSRIISLTLHGNRRMVRRRRQVLSQARVWAQSDDECRAESRKQSFHGVLRNGRSRILEAATS